MVAARGTEDPAAPLLDCGLGITGQASVKVRRKVRSWLVYSQMLLFDGFILKSKSAKAGMSTQRVLGVLFVCLFLLFLIFSVSRMSSDSSARGEVD